MVPRCQWSRLESRTGPRCFWWLESKVGSYYVGGSKVYLARSRWLKKTPETTGTGRLPELSLLSPVSAGAPPAIDGLKWLPIRHMSFPLERVSRRHPPPNEIGPAPWFLHINLGVLHSRSELDACGPRLSPSSSPFWCVWERATMACLLHALLLQLACSRSTGRRACQGLRWSEVSAWVVAPNTYLQ